MASNIKSENGSYYSGFTLEANQVLRFTDFKLEFKGQTLGSFYPGSKTRRMGDIYHFEATHQDEVVKFNWSIGTGQIGSAAFVINGKKFELAPFLPPGVKDQSEKFENRDTLTEKKEYWFCFPTTPDEKMILSTPAYFINDLEVHQKIVPPNSDQFGFVEMIPEKPMAEFLIASHGWLNGKLFESLTYRYPMIEKKWKLPVGFYFVGGVSPGMSNAYFEVKPNEVVKVLIKESKDPGPIGKKSPALRATKPRLQAKFDSKVLIDNDNVTEFEGGFNLSLKKVEDKMISFWICFDLDPKVIGAPCTTIPAERFQTMKTSYNQTLNYEIENRTYQVKILSVDSVNKIYVQVNQSEKK